MFIQNKYTKCYFRIIENRTTNKIVGYSEKHHIIPYSLGGTNDRSNLVRLSAREHWICHLLLMKMLEGRAKFKMMAAIGRMAISNKQGVRTFSRTYQMARRMHAEAASLLGKGRKLSKEHREKIRNAALALPPEIRKKISDSARVKSNEMREKLRNIALKRSAEHYEKVSAAMKGKPRPKSKPQPILTCQHCGLQAIKQTITKLHNAKCKKLTQNH